MKKAICAALTVTLALGLGTLPALAASGAETVGLGEQDISVQAVYNDGSTSPTVYSVDLTWGAMEFTYSVQGSNQWNPSNHTYTPSTTAGWSANGNEITATNHSNAGVKASFAFAAKTGFTGITGAFSSAALTLPSAEGKPVGAAELTGKTALTLRGALPDSVTTKTAVGTVTVKLSAS